MRKLAFALGHNVEVRFHDLGASEDASRWAALDNLSGFHDDDFITFRSWLKSRSAQRSMAPIRSAFAIANSLASREDWLAEHHDLTTTELRVRRHLLEERISARPESAIRFSEAFHVTGEELFRASCDHGLEGVIAKHLGRPYRSGRLGDWVKVKCIQSESFFIVGYERSAGAFRSLMLVLIAVTKWSTSEASAASK